MYNIGGAHIQCVNNHNANFEYKKMKTVGVTDYTNHTPLCISDGKNIKFNTRQKCEKKIMDCVQNRQCTSSMCEQCQ